MSLLPKIACLASLRHALATLVPHLRPALEWSPAGRQRHARRHGLRCALPGAYRAEPWPAVGRWRARSRQSPRRRSAAAGARA